MPGVEILGSGRIDDRELTAAQAVQLPNGDILCSFGIGRRPHGSGGTDWARSTDGGETWGVEGTILAPTTDPDTTNFLKLTLSPDGGTIYAYGSRSYWKPGARSRYPAPGWWRGSQPKQRRSRPQPSSESKRDEPVFCRSMDGGHTWSAPQVIPTLTDDPLEISHGMLALSSGRLLAPTALWPPGRLGERVVAAVSDDGGRTWPTHAVVFQDPGGKLGYIEQKLAELAPGRLISTCWTTTLGDVKDLESSFTLSNDDGSTWSVPVSTGIMGQTMTPIPLGGDRLLVLYNKRYGDQAIMMALVTFTEEAWTVHYKGVMYDGPKAEEGMEGQWEFGFPTAIRLQDGTYIATHQSREGGRFGIRWTKLRVDF